MVVSVKRMVLPAGHTFVRAGGFPYWTLELMLNGQLELMTAAGKATIPAGDLSLISPRTPYREQNAIPSEEIFAFFQPRLSWQPLMGWPATPAGTLHMPLNGHPYQADIHSAMQRLANYFTTVGANRARLLENTIEQVLLLATSPDRTVIWDDRVQQAIAYIQRRLGTALSVEQVAEQVGLSPSRLAHCFRRQMGMPLMRFVETRRLEEARSLLLHTNLPIKQIAYSLGFSSPFHFATRFRHRCGQTPTDFRRHPDQLDPIHPTPAATP